MSDELERTGSRFMDVCVTLLLASMALWGAVQILASIWIWLCVGIAVVLLVGVPVWIGLRRRSRW